MTALARTRLALGLSAGALLAAMLWIGQVHIAPHSAGRWMPQADPTGYGVVRLSGFASALAAAGAADLYTFSNRWLDGAFALLFGGFIAAMLWPARIAGIALGLAYAATDLTENRAILSAFAPDPGAAPSWAGALTALKFALIALAAGTLAVRRLRAS